MSKFLYCLLFQGLTISAYAQYASGVMVPDKTKPVVSSLGDTPYRYASNITADALKKDLSILASDSLQGRETGQKGMQLAADYISQNLKGLGLKSFAIDTPYYQNVSFTYSKWADTDIYVKGVRYRHLWDYLAFPDKNTTNPAILAKDVIFLGYGIDDKKYSDYKKIDVKGKIIMINRGEPLKADSTSYITKSRTMSEWSNDDMDKKLKLAKSKGVKLVMIIENDVKKLLEINRKKLLGTYLELGDTKERTNELANNVYISSTIAKAIIGDDNAQKVLDARKKLSKGKPASVVLPTDIIVNLGKESTLLKGKNIVGYIEGRSKKDEFVIVSAHYDHLGKRGDEVFNGADDNGSGSSTLMELSRAYSQAVFQGYRPERSIAFVWFCGEEKGLLGSEYYAENPLVPLEKTVVDVNVDMVGRVDEKYTGNPDYVYVIGSDRLSTDLHKISEEANQKYSQMILDYTYNAEDDPNKYYYRSDHYNFAKNGIPSIFYFNGVHADYHQPSDDIDKINFEAMEKRAKLIFYTIWELANRPNRIVVDGVVK